MYGGPEGGYGRFVVIDLRRFPMYQQIQWWLGGASAWF